MHKKEFNLKELALLTQSKLIGCPDWTINNVSDLETAEEHDASFLANPRYDGAMRTSKAGVIFVNPQTIIVEGKNYLINESPSQAFQKVIDALHANSNVLSGFDSIHPTAVIHPTAILGEGVTVGPYAVIDQNAQIGSKTFIGSGAYIGPGTEIGNDCIIHPRVTIRERCKIGNRVILQPGAVIGSCGFGYINDPQSKQHIKLNQCGIVVLEDDVEVGANTTIDRARFKATRIGKGTKIDNLVQIGHGVIVGACNLIIAQTGIAGSTETGRYVVLAGQVAVNGHIKIADGVMVAGRSGITKSLTESGKYGGVPAIPLNEHNRQSVFLKNIEKTVEEVKALKKRVEELEADLS